MNPLIHPEITGALRPLTDEEYMKLRKKLMQEKCIYPLLFFYDGKTPTVLDGHHRWRVCTEEHIQFNWYDMTHAVRNVAEAVAWVKENQAARRNLTPEEIEALHVERIHRVQAAHAEGKSTRTIAEEERISKTQVLRDLEDSRGPGGPPDHEPSFIKGLDGKQYKVQQGVMCDRCKRTGQIQGCPMCKRLRADKPKPPRKGKGEADADHFDLRAFNGHIQQALEQVDTLAAQHKLVNQLDHLGFTRTLNEVKDGVAKWHKALIKGKRSAS